jgi:hypothetical protein
MAVAVHLLFTICVWGSSSGMVFDDSPRPSPRPEIELIALSVT